MCFTWHSRDIRRIAKILFNQHKIVNSIEAACISIDHWRVTFNVAHVSGENKIFNGITGFPYSDLTVINQTLCVMLSSLYQKAVDNSAANRLLPSNTGLVSRSSVFPFNVCFVLQSNDTVRAFSRTVVAKKLSQLAVSCQKSSQMSWINTPRFFFLFPHVAYAAS